MNYCAYAGNSSDHTQELIALLSEDDVKKLAKTLKSFSLSTYTEWVMDNEAFLNRFLSLTPSKRKKKEYKELEPPYWLLTVFACIQRAESSRAFLRAFDNNLLDRPHTYRAMTIYASQAYEQAYREVGNPFSFWAFEDVCPTPFDSDS